MEKKLFAISLMCSLLAVRTGYAANDVFVDLSVLDAVDQKNADVIAQEPLFPPVVSKSISGQKGRSQPRVKLPMPEEAKPLPSSLVAEELTAPLVSEEETEEVPSDSLFLPHENPFADIAKSSEDKTETESDALSVTEENNSEVEKQPVSEQQEAPLSDKEVTETESDSLSQQTEANAETIYSSIPQTEAEQVETTESILSARINDAQMTGSQESQPKEIYLVSFAENSSDLSEEEKQRLGAVSQSFEQSKKIAIKAYYYDDGENSFAKKRICLNRATEVRSYLLAQGFKNFSIKIISTTADNENKNTVEIEEMK